MAFSFVKETNEWIAASFLIQRKTLGHLFWKCGQSET